MAPLAKDKVAKIQTGGATRVGEGDVAAATVIYAGAVIARNAGGFVVPASDTAGLKVIGISEEKVDNSAGANGAKTVKYITGITAELENAGSAIVQASKHGTCVAADDQSVTTAALGVNDIVVGSVVSFTTTKVQVYIDERANA
jgi:hypothetical protein